MQATFPSALKKVLGTAAMRAVRRAMTWLLKVSCFQNQQEDYLKDAHLKSMLEKKVLAGKKESRAPH